MIRVHLSPPRVGWVLFAAVSGYTLTVALLALVLVRVAVQDARHETRAATIAEVTGTLDSLVLGATQWAEASRRADSLRALVRLPVCVQR